MRKKMMKLLIAACFCMAGTGTITSHAAKNLETESSVAGISVALNHYYAGSQNPDQELAELLGASETGAEVQKSAKSEEVPQVKGTQSAYENVAISRVSNYVNVRSEANTTSSVVGKIYNNCAATILNKVSGEGGEWYHIQSGTVKGYIKAEYFITGTEAEKIAKNVGVMMGTVKDTATLRLREQPDLSSKTLTLLANGAEYLITADQGDYAKLQIDTDLEGYVYKQYLDIRVDFKQAVSLEEEQAKLDDDARRKQEADEAIQKLAELKASEEANATTAKQTTQAPATTAAPTTIESKPEQTTKPKTTADTTEFAPPTGGALPTTAAPTTQAPTKAPTTAAAPPKTTAAPAVGPGGSSPGGSSGGNSGAVISATRTAIVAYAKQFLGNPYVYGGTSLTNGADCSGFTQGIYSHFGITTGRSSRDQAARGKEISVASVQPGDLLFYASGDYINHVAMYIGGGQVIHASTSKTGIIISPSNYRTPCKAVTFLE